MIKAAAQGDTDQSILNYQRRKTRLQILFRDMMKAAAQEDEDQSILNYQRWKTWPQILFRDQSPNIKSLKVLSDFPIKYGPKTLNKPIVYLHN